MPTTRTTATADRVMRARRESICPICQLPIRVGQQIGRRGVWQHIEHVLNQQRSENP